MISDQSDKLVIDVTVLKSR